MNKIFSDLYQPNSDLYSTNLSVESDKKLEEQLRDLSPLYIGTSPYLANPYLQGYGFILFTDQIGEGVKYAIAPWDYTADGNNIFTQGFNKEEVEANFRPPYKSHTTFFKILERTFKEISGIQDFDLATTQMQRGTTENTVDFPTSISGKTTEITLQVQELEGKLYSAPLERWVTGIRDPETNLYTLPGAGKREDYSVSAIYFTTGPNIAHPNPDVRKSQLQSAFFFSQMFPTAVPKSFNDTQGGSKNEVTVDFRFKVVTSETAKVFAAAQKILASEDFYMNFIMAPKNKAVPHNNASDISFISVSKDNANIINKSE